MTTEEQPKPLTQEQLYECIHEVSDCILKHSFTYPIYILEGIEAAIQKGLDPEPLIKIHAQATEVARKTLSLILPENQCIAQIPELWQAVGWMNGAEEHMIQKYEEFRKNTPPELKEFVENLKTMMHATRTLRRNLERELFKSIAEALPQFVGLQIEESLPST